MVSLRLDVRHGLVVGGGPAAVERVRALLHAGAQVKLVAPEIALELRHRAAWGEVLHLPRSFRESDLDGMKIVLVANDDADASRHIAELARARGILVNVADQPLLSDFRFPAVHPVP